MNPLMQPIPPTPCEAPLRQSSCITAASARCHMNHELIRQGIHLTASQIAFIDQQRRPTGESRSGWIRRLIQEQAEWTAQIQQRRNRGAA